jgi:asparagine synthase (glutamine-hydrolysing)
MAHSVEARVPYMDHRIVEYAFALPADFKVGNGDRKRILRDMARTLLPPVVTERKDRMGFATPDDILISGAFWTEVRDAVTDRSYARLPLFDAKALPRFVDDYDRGSHQDIRAIWRLYALAAWRDEFSVSM